MAVELHLTNIDNEKHRYSVEQGALYDKIIILHERDLTGWNFQGSIRTHYASLNGTVVTSFTFLPVVYEDVTICDVVKRRSVIKPRLSIASTQTMAQFWVNRGMRQRRTRGEAPIIGSNVWVYDIDARLGTEESIRIMQGYIDVDLEVTT